MIPSALLDPIVAGVDAMATPTYNFNYGAPDVFPIVDTGAPLVFLEFPEAVGLPAEGNVVGRYTIDQPLAFRVLVPASDSVPDEEQAELVANDIKQLMNDLEPTLKAAGMSFADLLGSTQLFRLVRAYPVQVTVNFNIRFRQLKSAPGG